MGVRKDGLLLLGVGVPPHLVAPLTPEIVVEGHLPGEGKLVETKFGERLYGVGGEDQTS